MQKADKTELVNGRLLTPSDMGAENILWRI